MQEALQSILDYPGGNWPELPWIVAAAGVVSWLAERRSRLQWQKYQYLDRLNVSFTTVGNGVCGFSPVS